MARPRKTASNRDFHNAWQARFCQIFERSFTTIDAFFDGVLQPVFGHCDLERENIDLLETTPELKSCSEICQLHAVTQVGTCHIENQEFKIYKISLRHDANLRPIRFHIQRMIRTFHSPHSHALIVLHHEGSANVGWRLSYVPKRFLAQTVCAMQRFTFLLGPDCNVCAAADRFATLATTKNLCIRDISQAFSVTALTQSFYTKLYRWYEWAQDSAFHVTFPGLSKHSGVELKEHLIRWITRLIFVWFMKQKHEMSDDLFDPNILSQYIKHFNPNAGFNGMHCQSQRAEISNYHRIILENLFLVMLNPTLDHSTSAIYWDEGCLTELGRTELLHSFRQIHGLNAKFFEHQPPSEVQRTCAPTKAHFTACAFIPNVLFFSEDEAHPGILTLLKQYPFTLEESTSNDIYIALDPEVMGNIFENLLASYNPETEKTARKATGSFYTPREVVHYMVETSLCEHIKTQIELIPALGIIPADIDTWIYEKNCPEALSNHQDVLQNLLLNTKILDPACGSGAFPMGILSCLLELLSLLTPSFSDHIYDFKKKIIENVLHGIDIQPLAIELTKLRCLISLMIEENPTSSRSNPAFSTLSKLDQQFVVANALIPTNISTAQRVIPLPDPKWIFKNAHDFDIVIGNPPYGAPMKTSEKRIYKDLYSNLTQNYDIYMVFFEMGFRITRHILCYITPDKWLANNYAEKFRANICLPHLKQITQLGATIFDSARVDAIVALLTRKETDHTDIYRFQPDHSIQYINNISLHTLEEPYLLDQLFLVKTESMKGIEKKPYRLSDYCICDYAFANPHTVYALKPFLSEGTSESIPQTALRIINTGTIGKYRSRWYEKPMTYLKSKYRYPYILREHLRDLLGTSASQRLTAPKIVCKGLNLMDACLDLEGQYISTAATLNVRCKVHHSDLLKVICGIINSDIVIQYLKDKYIASSWNGALRFNPEMLLNLPVPSLEDLSPWEPLIEAVDQIMSFKDTSMHAEEIDALKSQINAFVNDMYAQQSG